MTPPKGLLALAESVADGAAIDWAAEESTSAGDDRALMRQLRVIAELAALHRTLPADPSALPHALSLRRTAAAPAVGRWAHLDLIERLGGGAFGDVYRAFDRHLEREVALKLLHADVIPEPDFQSSRIVGEGRRLARVHHPNIVTVYGVAMHDGRVGLWMELIKGLTLEQIVKTSGAMSAGEAALVGVDLCRALAALHAADLIHRDIKGQNVMREDGGRIVLMDFGTSRAANPDEWQPPQADLAGTPLYLAPEIFNGAPASMRTDIYSLGVLLYRLVTSEVPVRASTLEELREAHETGRRVRLRDARADLPSGFVRVVEKAIAADPADRYATAGELEADLLNARGETQTVAVDETRRPGHRVVWWAAAAVAALTVGALTSLWPSRQALAPRVTAVAPGAIKSLAVLPLANVSGDASLDYMADAMTDELIGTLARLDGVSVISRTSSMQFKATKARLPEIARALHADAILEGSILVGGGRPFTPSERTTVRVNARLIEAGSDTQIWDRTFEHALTDIIALQRDVAAAIADSIQARMSSQAASTGRGTRNPEAQDAYLRGRSYLDSAATDRLSEARRWLENAVTLDPDYAQAYAALSDCYVWLEVIGAVPPQEARSKARSAAARALSLDAGLAEAHEALANIDLADWNWPQAEASYQRALALNPSTLARRNYAWYLAADSRVAAALAQARLAEASDPLNAEAFGAVAMMLYFNRDYDAALVKMRAAAALAPNAAQIHNGLARVYAAKGMFPDAITEIQRAIRLSNDAPPYVGELARTYAAAGDVARARTTLSRLQRDAARSKLHVDPQLFGYVFAALHDASRAFDYLDRSVRERSPGIAWAAVDPRLDPVRQDPRYAVLVRSIGLPASRDAP